MQFIGRAPGQDRLAQLRACLLVVVVSGGCGCLTEPESTSDASPAPLVSAEQAPAEATADPAGTSSSRSAAPPSPADLLRSVQLQAETMHGLTVQLQREHAALDSALEKLEASASALGERGAADSDTVAAFETGGDGMKRAALRLQELSDRVADPATELARSSLLLHIVEEGGGGGGSDVR